jgi:hypothetical protein
VVAATDAALSASSASSSLQGANNKPVLHVATVGAQLRSVADAADSMCAAAGVTPSGRRLQQADHSPHADALLLVSGSHPARQLPFAQQLLPGTLALLQRGSALQQAGVLPPGLELWAVANPLTERDASYTEQKVAAGAQVILTQPPLDWEAFAGWLDDAQRRGVMSAARVLVGFPCLSSAANAGFWAALCNAGGNAQVRVCAHWWLPPVLCCPASPHCTDHERLTAVSAAVYGLDTCTCRAVQAAGGGVSCC